MAGESPRTGAPGSRRAVSAVGPVSPRGSRLAEAGRLEDVEPRGPVAPGVGRQVRLAADRLEHLASRPSPSRSRPGAAAGPGACPARRRCRGARPRNRPDRAAPRAAPGPRPRVPAPAAPTAATGRKRGSSSAAAAAASRTFSQSGTSKRIRPMQPRSRPYSWMVTKAAAGSHRRGASKFAGGPRGIGRTLAGARRRRAPTDHRFDGEARDGQQLSLLRSVEWFQVAPR